MSAKDAKWRGEEIIADWLKEYSSAGGKIIFQSQEGDGVVWGYEFNGKGKLRLLKLKSVGKWI